MSNVIVDQWGNPLVIPQHNKVESIESNEVRRLKQQVAELEKQLQLQNENLNKLQQKQQKEHDIINKLSNDGLIIQDKVTGKWYNNDDGNEAVILRSLIEIGADKEVSVEATWEGYKKWIDMLEKNPNGSYTKTIEDVKSLKTTAQKLIRYINSIAFLGNKSSVAKANMVKIISYHPDKFREVISECGGNPDHWQQYILNSQNPWEDGVEVEGHHIKVIVNATIYSDSAKDYAYEVDD